MNTSILPANPFKRIALSLSGGGYRAASFHLGSMAYLQHISFENKPLLENVKMISTVSGGTITGIVYALLKQDQKSFNEVYTFLMKQLREVDLLKEGIEKLGTDGKWNNEEKTQNLINSFAELYDQHLTGGRTFRELNIMKSHLECVVFNSTEFRYAINFRFRNWGSGFFGNNNIRIEQNVVDEIKLSDAMASSSCFTGGFEPLLFPKDFIHSNSPNLRQLKKTSEELGLMDGGIYDNQGIDSILLYNDSKTGRDFDLIIISDVASPYMEPYQATGGKEDTSFRRQTIKQLISKGKRTSKLVGFVIFILALSCVLIPSRNNFSPDHVNGFFLGLGTGLFILLFVKIWLVSKIKNLLGYGRSLLKKFIPEFHYDKLKHLKIEEMTFGRAEPLVLDRVSSLIKLMMDVFLKIIRRLNYNNLYKNEQFQNRRISNLIKELTEEDFNQKKQRSSQQPATAGNTDVSAISNDYLTAVGPIIKAVVEEASAFGTTLWFNDKEGELHGMLNKLVATGQLTMCYNLIVYLESLMFDNKSEFLKYSSGIQNELQKMYVACLADWQQFKKDPMFLSGQFK